MRTRITLECTECKQRNYNTTKDKKTHPDRVETKKYCKFCQKHTLHKETKQFELMEGKKMAEATKKKESRIKTWWTGVKAEFSRIIWPDKATIIRQTVVVVVITIIVGVLISHIDSVVQLGLDAIIGR